METTTETSSVEAVFKQGEETIQQQVAIKAIGMVKPMLDDARQQISDYVGDAEKIIIINKTKMDSPLGIMVMDARKDFTIKGGGEKLQFTGEKSAMLKYYTAEEFVEMLLTGQLKELTEKLLK